MACMKALSKKAAVLPVGITWLLNCRKFDILRWLILKCVSSIFIAVAVVVGTIYILYQGKHKIEGEIITKERKFANLLSIFAFPQTSDFQHLNRHLTENGWEVWRDIISFTDHRKLKPDPYDTHGVVCYMISEANKAGNHCFSPIVLGFEALFYCQLFKTLSLEVPSHCINVMD